MANFVCRIKADHLFRGFWPRVVPFHIHWKIASARKYGMSTLAPATFRPQCTWTEGVWSSGFVIRVANQGWLFANCPSKSGGTMASFVVAGHLKSLEVNCGGLDSAIVTFQRNGKRLHLLLAMSVDVSVVSCAFAAPNLLTVRRNAKPFGTHRTGHWSASRRRHALATICRESVRI
ncbi:MAG: hypothetical protein DMG39_16880 [Acidobacteria bacterium]|nr:MAG: hypothetical protein DMG39_16880 [Acidobacteriota bacterium]